MMAQEFRVVQCYSCNTFQVDIIKKVPKWSCKMCGEKQSVKKIYVNGSAKKCRLIVQDLNEKRIRFETEELPGECHLQSEMQKELPTKETENNKWLEFLENIENNEIICNKRGKQCVELQKELPINKEKGNKWLEFLGNTEMNEAIYETEKSYVNKSNDIIYVPEKRELQTSNLNCKKLKLDPNIEQIGVKNVQSKNLFDSENNPDFDSLLDI